MANLVLVIMLCMFAIGLIMALVSICTLDLKTFIIFTLMCLIGFYGLYRVNTNDAYKSSYTRYRTDYIVNINDTTRISGTRYYISEKDRYVYYKKHYGGYKIKSIPVKNATVYYTKNSPRIEVLVKDLKQDKFTQFFKGSYGQKVQYDIYVPKGSVANSFEFDGKK